MLCCRARRCWNSFEKRLRAVRRTLYLISIPESRAALSVFPDTSPACAAHRAAIGQIFPERCPGCSTQVPPLLSRLAQAPQPVGGPSTPAEGAAILSPGRAHDSSPGRPGRGPPGPATGKPWDNGPLVEEPRLGAKEAEKQPRLAPRALTKANEGHFRRPVGLGPSQPSPRDWGLCRTFFPGLRPGAPGLCPRKGP